MGILEPGIDHKCPQCESLDTVCEIYEDSFQFGAQDDDPDSTANVPLITVDVPLYRCINANCGFEWFDWKAETIKDAAVREHLLKIKVAIQDEQIIILNKALDDIEARCDELISKGPNKYVQ